MSKNLQDDIVINFLWALASEKDKAIIIVLEDVGRGAILRTQGYPSNDFLINDTESLLSV